jgi:hypothetical protein
VASLTAIKVRFGGGLLLVEGTALGCASVCCASAKDAMLMMIDSRESMTSG